MGFAQVPRVEPSEEIEFINCEKISESSKVLTQLFKVNSEEFPGVALDIGWLPWSEQLLTELGLPAASGYSWQPDLKSSPIQFPEGYRYDFLFWIPADMNADGLEDRLVVTSYLQGKRGRYHYGNDIFLFCNSLEQGSEYKPCGNFGYWADSAHIGDTVTARSVGRLPTNIQDSRRYFAEIQLLGNSYLAAVGESSLSDSDAALALDLWTFVRDEPRRLQTCFEK
ncbi:hypothetical protein [Ruegeria atlantica]|uniref:hypothetical protein n=1 Tax=Ruegeria atlantica TaxID=81569 RepID=UPI002494A242|nr:hypothetical protein [Ruegeria atlantica]